jgi:hypothetical protein
MFTAISKNTGERVDAITATTENEYADHEFYADPLDIKKYDENKVEDINKIPVTLVDEKMCEEEDGTKKYSPPYFKLVNKEALGIETHPEQHEHRLAKSFIADTLRANPDLKFSFTRKDKTHNIPLTTFDFDLKQIIIEEVFSGTKRRADIIIPSKQHQHFIGQGLVIEIQYNEKSSEHEWRRTKEHAMRGYSVGWLKPHHYITEQGRFILTTPTIPFTPLNHLHERIQEEADRDFRALVKQQFYGCSRFPTCTGRKKIRDDAFT